MSSPWFDSREVVSLFHTFLEGWALFFFVVVVACDLSLYFLEERKGPVWKGWSEHTHIISLRKYFWPIKVPAFGCVIGLKSFLKTLSVCSFAVAIILEAFAYPLGQRNDAFSNKEIAFSNERALEALRKAAVAANDLLATKAQLITEQANLQKQLQMTAKAQKEAADAQYKWNQALANHTFSWRQIDNSVVPLFSSLPKARAEILYKKGDGEAYMFALDIVRALGKRGPGWDVPDPIPTDSPEGSPPLMDIQLFVRSTHDPMKLISDGASESPKLAITLVMRLARIHGIAVDSNLPEGFFKIVVGERVGPE